MNNIFSGIELDTNRTITKHDDTSKTSRNESNVFDAVSEKVENFRITIKETSNKVTVIEPVACIPKPSLTVSRLKDEHPDWEITNKKNKCSIHGNTKV